MSRHIRSSCANAALQMFETGPPVPVAIAHEHRRRALLTLHNLADRKAGAEVEVAITGVLVIVRRPSRRLPKDLLLRVAPDPCA